MPITSPNMNLPVPVVGVDSGPAWATYLDQCLSIIDGHTHQSGAGVPLTPGAININADLAFNGNNATLLRTTRYSVQGSAITSSTPDIAALYSVGGELYWNDTAGNQVPITHSGNVNAGAGSITNLPFSGAATFNSSTNAYVWEASAAPTSAFMDNAGIILRYNSSTPSPSGAYILVQPPSSISGANTLTLPIAPGAPSFVTLDSSGTMAAGAIPIANGITRNNQAAVGQQISASCGVYNPPNGSQGAVTNLSVTITTTGRPVVVGMISDGSSNVANLSVSATPSALLVSQLQLLIKRSGTTIASGQYGGQLAAVSGGSAFVEWGMGLTTLDVVAAGTYTYTVSAAQFSSGGSIAQIENFKLMAYEL